MKKTIHLLLLSVVVLAVNAQPCTELFFSEYIEGTGNNKALEIFNPTSSPINLSAYKVQLYSNGSSTVQTTLNLAGTIGSDSVYVIANSQASAVIKSASDTLSGVTNFNGNDAVALVKGTANIDIIGQIGIDPGATGWTLSGGGFTANQTLTRRPQVHEGTTDWTQSSTQWVILPVDTSFLGNHVQSPCPTPADTTIEFNTASNSVSEGEGSYDIILTLLQAAGTDKTVDVILQSGDSTDMGNYMTQTVTIPANFTSQTLTVSITNDTLVEGDEQFVFALVNPSAGLSLGSDSIFTLTITDNDSAPVVVPYYPIATVTSVNSTGVADSNGVRCTISGVVYGINLRDSGLQFTIHDGTGGMGVFSSSKTFGYAVQEGDSVVVSGEVGQFSGYTQMESLDTLYKVGTGTLRQPAVITAFGESSESELIRINNAWLVDANQWDNSNANGFTVDVTNGTETFELRVEEQVDLFNQNPPTSNFDVIGLGSQFDNSSPFDEGYQVLPRYTADVILHTGIADEKPGSFKIYPNPSSGIFSISVDNAGEQAIIKISDITGKIIYGLSVPEENKLLTTDLGNVPKGIFIVELSSPYFTAKRKVCIF